jgi:hypothetical protein
MAAITRKDAEAARVRATDKRNATKRLANLIRAAQAVCQSRGGSDPEATRVVHDKAVCDLEAALLALNLKELTQ